MIRVLTVEAAGNLWGSERALLDLLAGMPNLEVAVCCPPERPLNAELEKSGIRVLPYYVYGLHQKSKWHRGRAALGVLRACLEFKPDVIYLNQAGAYKVAFLAAKLLNVPIVAHIRIFEDVAYLAQQRPSSHHLHSLIAISAAVCDEIQLFPELRDIRLFHVYDAYAPLRGPAFECWPRRAENRVACVGRLVPVKGQDVLVAALGFLQRGNERIDCLLAGEGDENFVLELKQLATNEGVASSIQWLGFVGDVVPLLETCSILVCPSHREPLGRVIFEAWDAGAVPLVFSGSGGAAEIVTAARGGILYDQQKPKVLACALREAVNLDPSRVEELVNNGRLWMAKNCNLKISGDAVSKILVEACVARSHSLAKVG
jgi:glycosyltransferase involved in cell wall biosynthesis